MTITANFAAKLSVAFVAAAMMFSLVAPANAQQSASELQAEIDRLLQMISGLENQLNTGGGSGSGSGVSSSADVCPFTWTRDLSSGSTGADVRALQQFLNSDPDTQVAPAGQVGGPGMETDFYGPATGAAVSKFQMKYRSEILSPLGLVNPTQYFGAGSRGVANDLCTTPVEEPSLPSDGGTDDGSEDGSDEEDESEEEDEEEEMELSGNADLETLELDDPADDDVQEAQDDQPVAEVDVEFEDGDARVENMEFYFTLDSGQSGAESDPWDTFENISLWLDGDKLAEVETDDEDEWRGGDDNRVDFNDLDLVMEEDQEYTFIIGASVQNGLDFDNDNMNSWTVSFDGDNNPGGQGSDNIRYEDANGFVQEDDGESSEANFDIEEEGAEDELDVRTSDADPESTTLPLEDDEDTNLVPFAFDLDAEDSESDIEFDQLVVDFTMSSGTLPDFVDDAELIVDGNEVTTEDEEINNGNVTFTFDTNDWVIDAGDRVTVEVELEFSSLSPANEGVTIRGSIDGVVAAIDAEGADDLSNSELNGSATGDEHTLRTTGIIYTTDFDGSNDGLDDTFSVRENNTQGSDASLDDEGIFTFTFEVEAFEDDAYINDRVASGTAIADDPAAGIFITVVSDGTKATSTELASTFYTISGSSADQESSGRYRIDEGEAETFEVKVELDPNGPSGDGYEVQLQGVGFNTTDADANAFQRALPVSAFDTTEETI